MSQCDSLKIKELMKTEENKTSIEEKNEALLQACVSDSDLQATSDLVLSFLRDGKCTAIPTRILFGVLKRVENNNISFTFKNESKSKWTVIHALYCHCR